MGITSRLAEFVCRTSFEDLPAEVIEQSKNMMLDAAAVGLAAAAQPEGVAIANLAKEMQGNGKCTIMGMGLRTSPTYAALVNGTLVRLLEFDSEIVRQGSHATSMVFPVVMSLGEMHGYSGPEVLTAFALGCEAIGKLGASGQKEPPPGSSEENDGVAGPVGAAVAAGKLLGLNQEQLQHAIGLACGAAGGIMGDFTTPGHALQYGRAAMNGVMAALLASRGFAGPLDAVEAPGGLLERHLGMDGVAILQREEALAARLGHPYGVMQPGITMKLYACHSAGHTAIDAVLQLQQQYRLTSEQVAGVTVKVTPEMRQTMPFTRPRTGGEARHSLEYVVAAALLQGQPLLEQFTDEAAQDAALRGMLERITVEPAEEATGLILRPCSIAIALADGRELHHQVEYARGQPEFPLEPEEVDAKFLYCTRYILPPDHIEESIDKFRNLENNPNITGLASVLGG